MATTTGRRREALYLLGLAAALAIVWAHGAAQSPDRDPAFEELNRQSIALQAAIVRRWQGSEPTDDAVALGVPRGR